MYENKISFFSKRYRMQILVDMAANFMYFAHGLGVGWISPTVQILQSPDSPLNFTVDVDQVSWIGSMFGIGFFVGNIIFGLLVNRLSHKFNMYLLSLPHILYWILNYTVQSVEYLYAGRFFAGATSGGLFVIFPIFLSEILNKDIRGALLSLGMMVLSLGVLTGFILPTQLDYYVTPCIALAFPITYIILLCFFPETPQSLIKKNRLDEAEAAYNFYNGIENTKKSSALEESKTDTENLTEFEELKTIILQGQSNGSVMLEDFLKRSSLKSFANGFVLCTLYQFSGSFAFVTYMNSIFVASGSTLDHQISTIIVGSVHIIGIFCSTILVERLGRRTLLFSSVGCMTIGMYAFGAFVQFTDATVKAQYNWVPLVFVMFIVFSSAYGLFGNFFTIVVEVLPAKIRSQALAICMGFVSLLLFVVLKLYPYFLFNLGILATMWTSATACVITGTYLFIFLPETKGKSMVID